MTIMPNPIALVTCYFQPNYGSQLQALATQKYFDSLGVANETIRIDGLRGEINKRKYRYFLSRLTDPHTIKDKWATVKKTFARMTNKTYAAHLAERYEMFKRFAEEEFHLSRVYEGFEDLHEASGEYAAFVVGSDQLWLPSNIAADYYTLNFVKEGVPRIALATSFGISRLPSAQAKKAREFLPKIDCCSVREQSGQQLIKDLTGREVPVVCDPTILFTAEEWSQEIPAERFVKGKKVAHFSPTSSLPQVMRLPEKYMLCYFLGNNPLQREFVRRVKAWTGLKIVQIQHCDEYIRSDEGFPDEAPYNVGPKEFIRLVRDAEYVFTDSFHCSVFSMLYAKKFFTFRRYHSDSIVSTNGRIYSLLALVGQERRLLKGDEDVPDTLAMEIDYAKVHAKLGELRDFTKAFIIDALDKAGITHD